MENDYLEKLLFAAGGVDEFLQWMMGEIDILEDKLFDIEEAHDEEEISQIIGAYEALLKVRDKYCEFQQSKS